jgi:pimeloyl-ACP methyl ester carboxylesterase
MSSRSLIYAAAMCMIFCHAVSAVAEVTPQVTPQENTMRYPTRYKSVEVDGLQIFYREAGPPAATTILLLHGFPSTSRMYEPLLQRLADRYHLIAPDYPGFGHSDAPPADKFAYTFDHIATVIDHFAQSVNATSYVLYVQDYGGPVGMRLAIAHPERVKALIIQNATSHEDGLGPLWDTRKAFWKDRNKYEAAVEQNLMSLAAAKQRHVGTSPEPDLYDPDLWTDEYAMLSRPGETAIQSDLFYNYQTNVASYPQWQEWLRKTQPKTLVIWGRYDPSQLAAEAAAYKRDLPNAEVHVMDAGHFALDLPPDADAIAAWMRDFLGRNGL